MDGDASMIGLGTPPDIGLGTPKGVVVDVPAAPPTADDPFAESAVKSISLEELAAKGFATRDEENWCCSIIMLISMCVLLEVTTYSSRSNLSAATPTSVQN